MGKPTVYTDTLLRAAHAVGGEARLAAALRVPLADLYAWLEGSVQPPTKVYQRALDILISVGRN